MIKLSLTSSFIANVLIGIGITTSIDSTPHYKDYSDRSKTELLARLEMGTIQKMVFFYRIVYVIAHSYFVQNLIVYYTKSRLLIIPWRHLLLHYFPRTHNLVLTSQ